MMYYLFKINKVIHLGAAANYKVVEKILDQLAPGGFFCGPIIQNNF